ncbi:MAG TPA: hypothetical protein VGI81_28485 [Tepidisphaeraceae bacterium]|jgi:hypothetical protein
MSLAGAVLLATFPLGCQPAPLPSSNPHPTVTVNGAPPGAAAPARPEQIEQAIGASPAGMRLQEISGALLEYYALHGRLPAMLAELESLPDLDQPLNFMSPTSGKPYAYVPAGLKSPTDTREIVVYDIAPDASGLRYVILLRRPRGREAAATWVDRIPEAMFQQYVR